LLLQLPVLACWLVLRPASLCSFALCSSLAPRLRRGRTSADTPAAFPARIQTRLPLAAMPAARRVAKVHTPDSIRLGRRLAVRTINPTEGELMAALETEAHLPALGAHARTETGEQLQQTLVELIALSLVGKQLHWNITGPEFRSLHLQLDELVDEWRELADVVAERAVALGFAPDGRAPAAVESGLEPVAPGPTGVPSALRELLVRVGSVDERVRERMARLGEIDLTSQDVLVDVTRTLEKQLWMLRVQL
jgi:starvation-inducible DNA-binding protein